MAAQPTPDSILSALARLRVGLTGESTPDCDWYEGIEHDAHDELTDAIADADPEDLRALSDALADLR